MTSTLRHHTARRTDGAAAFPRRLLPPVIIITLCAVLLLVSIATDRGVELTRPTATVLIGPAVGIPLGIFCLVNGLRRPVDLKTAVAAIMLAPVAGTISTLTINALIDRLHEAIVFRGPGMTIAERELVVSRGLVQQYRNRYSSKVRLSYQVWLRDYPVLLAPDRRDFIAAFGSAQAVMPSGYCVRVVVQSTGRYSRILATRGNELPAGRLHHCARPTR